MAFTRVNPGGWAVGAQLTSAQQNQLDIDHANALDKTSAGDTLSGVVHVTGTGQVHADAAFAIQATVATGIQSLIAAGIVSSAVGGIQLAGGAGDWPTFSATRGRVLTLPLMPLGALSSGWVTVNASLTGPATTTAQNLLLPRLHNGSTLSSIAMTVIVQGPHSSLPANLPTLAVRRVSLVTGAVVDLSTTAAQSPTPANAAAWDNGGAGQTWAYTCNQNNAIDTTQFIYFAQLVDENGANSVAGNKYFGLTMGFTGIADMRFA